MRVCFFSASPGTLDVLRGQPAEQAGGAEKQVCALARGLAQAGHEVLLVHGSATASDAGRSTVVDGVTCTAVGLSPRGPRDAWRLLALLRRTRPDVVYARLPHDMLAVLAAYARLHRPARFVYSIAYDPYCRPRGTAVAHGWFHDPLYALGLHLADRILVQHAGQRKLLAPRLRDRAVWVPNAVSGVAEDVRDLQDCTADVAWVAHLRPEKRVGVLLDLVASLPELRFVVAGAPSSDPQEQASLERRIAALPNLRYLGLVDAATARDVVRRSRVLLNTSEHEGFPNTMLEAWSHGVPVVSLSVDPDGVLSREGLGLLSTGRPGLRRDVLRLVSDDARNTALGRRALRYVRRHHEAPAVLARVAAVLAGDAVPDTSRVEESASA